MPAFSRQRRSFTIDDVVSLMSHERLNFLLKQSGKMSRSHAAGDESPMVDQFSSTWGDSESGFDDPFAIGMRFRIRSVLVL